MTEDTYNFFDERNICITIMHVTKNKRENKLKQQSRVGNAQKLTLLSIGVSLPSVFFFSELWLGASQSYSTSGLDKSRQKVQIHSPLLGDKVYEFLTHHFSLHHALSYLLHAIYDTNLFGMNFKSLRVYHIATVYTVPCWKYNYNARA